MNIKLSLNQLKEKLGEPIAIGNGREVFLSKTKKFVWKLPYENSLDCGDSCNYKEWESYTSNFYSHKGYNYLAKCKVVTTSDNRDALIMEKVEVVEECLEDRPYWVDFIDCQQVGLNRKNQLVAYDFGNF